MKIGFADVVMVSDFAVMRKIMFMDEYKDRPDFWFYTFSFDNILIQWSGDKHKEQRDLTAGTASPASASGVRSLSRIW
jgi:hypothetical protein